MRSAMLALVILGVVGSTVGCGQAADPPSPPNVVLIVADDLGWADVGYHGSVIETPNLDRLARAGVRLEYFYAFTSCSPSRAALLTGRHPMTLGLPGGILGARTEIGLPAEERTLAEALRDRGYRTAICGKWHLGHAQPEVLPRNQGFDHQYGCYLGGVDYFTRDHAGTYDWRRNGEFVYEDGYITDLLADEAVRLIEADDERPLFLFLPFTAPHRQVKVPAPYAAKYVGTSIEGRQIYAGAVTCLDDAVGRIVEALDKRKMLDNTLLVFLSDNGGADYAAASNAPLRGGKKAFYEGGIRVPAFAYWRGRLAKRIVEHPLRIIDWYPTIVQLAGGSLDQPRPLDGADIWATLTDGAAPPYDEYFYSATSSMGAIRRGDWKLVLDYTRQPPGVELFDIVRDPTESENLAAEHPQRVRALTDRLDELRAQASPPLQEDMRSALEGHNKSGSVKAAALGFERFLLKWRDGELPRDAPELQEQLRLFADDFEFHAIDGAALDLSDWVRHIRESHGMDRDLEVDMRIFATGVEQVSDDHYVVTYGRIRRIDRVDYRTKITADYRGRSEAPGQVECVRIVESPDTSDDSD